jgi:hypothetical protein
MEPRAASGRKPIVVDEHPRERVRAGCDSNAELGMVLAPVLTPHGVLALRRSGDGVALLPHLGAQLEATFARGSGHGLLSLGADQVGAALPAVFGYWREFGGRYVTALCALPGIAEGAAKGVVIPPDEGTLEQMAAAAPPMIGAEYLTAGVLAHLWRGMDEAFDLELAEAGASVQAFLRGRHPAWTLVGRVHFNLAENRKDEDAPFAFIATYTTRLSMEAKAQHLPLGKALREYGGARNRERLLSLLVPIQRAAEKCAWLKSMVDAGEIYHPLRWSPAQALQLLKDVPTLESAGVVVRMSASWRMNRPAHPQVKATVVARTGSSAWSLEDRCKRRFAPISGRGCNGSICLHAFAWGRAWATIWVSERPSKCWRCCWC